MLALVSLAHAGLDPDEVDAWLEDLPAHVRVELPEGLPPIPPVPVKEAGGPPADHPGESEGGLSGKAVYLSQCHGFIWYESLDGFSTQRGNLYDTVEDFHNPEGMNQYLAPMLENAGARVFTARERDMNPLMAIADNDGDGYSESGPGFEDGPAGFAEHGPWAYGEDPFDAGTTRRFPAGSVATWVPEVPEDGRYAVYVSWDSDSDNTTAATYTITHPGGVIERTYDQTVHGSTWQYVETLWLPAGVGGLTVELVGEGSGWLSADAVRIGGGMADVLRDGGTSGRPRWEDGATQYIQWNGAPTSVYDPYGDGDGSDPSSRSRWADWEHPSGEDAVYLSWHSNAGGGTGTSVYYTATTSASTYGISRDFAELLDEEIVDSARALWDSDWTDRGTHERDFSEVNPAHNDEMASALVELAFHDHAGDVELLKDPVFRWDASRAMYRAVVRYFADQDGTDPVFLPEPPEGFAVTQDAEGVRVDWQDGLVGAPFGDAATRYLLFRSADGRSWDEGSPASPGDLLELEPGELVFLRVASVNDGGVSFPSETLGVRRAAGRAPVLVVSAFDRLEVSLLPWVSYGGAIGDVRRMELHRVNPFDGAVAHGQALSDAGWPFDSLSDEALGEVDLDAYELVVWVAGEESTNHESFSSEQQQALRAFVEGGGALFASGSEILWDLDENGSDEDRAFATEVLGAALQEDDAGTTVVEGTGPLAGLDLGFGEEVGGAYPVEYPDVVRSLGDELALYGDGSLAAARSGEVVLFGFPFETVGSAEARAEVMARLVPELVDWEPGDTGQPWDDTGAPSLDALGPGSREPLAGCGCSSTSGLAAVLLLLLVRRSSSTSSPSRSGSRRSRSGS